MKATLPLLVMWAVLTGCGEQPVGPATPGPFDGEEVAAVAVGWNADRICAALADGTVHCASSQMLDCCGWEETRTKLPAPAVRIATGYESTCALLADSTVWCFREDTQTTPIQVAEDVVELEVSNLGYVCTRTSAGAVDCSDESGTPFAPSLAFTVGPLNLGGHAARAVAPIGFEIFALLDDGTVVGWSFLDNDSVSSPGTPVPGVTGAVALTASDGAGGDGFHACALRSDSTVVCWGSNDSGELGQGSASNTASSSALVVPGLASVVDVVAGGSHTCALERDGAVSCWGASGLFAGAKTMSNEGYFSATPSVVPCVSHERSLASGASVDCAVDGDGKLTCWGLEHFVGISTPGSGG
jgi:hypothetical protein